MPVSGALRAGLTLAAGFAWPHAFDYGASSIGRTQGSPLRCDAFDHWACRGATSCWLSAYGSWQLGDPGGLAPGDEREAGYVWIPASAGMTVSHPLLRALPSRERGSPHAGCAEGRSPSGVGPNPKSEILRGCRDESLPRVWGCPPNLFLLPPRMGDQGG